jgi:hypothetical protein
LKYEAKGPPAERRGSQRPDLLRLEVKYLPEASADGTVADDRCPKFLIIVLRPNRAGMSSAWLDRETPTNLEEHTKIVRK